MSPEPIDLHLQLRPTTAAALTRLQSELQGLGGEVAVLAREQASADDGTLHVQVRARNADHAALLTVAVRSLPDIDLLDATDRAFESHVGGTLRMEACSEIHDERELGSIYTPGVARVARAIEKTPDAAWNYTSLARTVGIFTNGTRVLGLGDIGPLASLPVMEGKAMLYSQLVGLSAMPILVDTRDPAVFVETVMRVAPSFGAIHLEDIRSPDCFAIEDALVARLKKPVLHDDQHGTAVAVLAAVRSACRLTGLSPARAVIGQIGLGAAGSAIAHLALQSGFREVLVHDTHPAARLRVLAWGARYEDMATLMRRADIVIAATGQPGLIHSRSIRAGQIVLALSNPSPEIIPARAIAAGAALASDGRQINNLLAFPGIMRGALRARAGTIVPAMLMAAIEALSALAPADRLLPSPLDLDVHRTVATAVALAATREGICDTLDIRPESLA